jgi:hypothetical protein
MKGSCDPLVEARETSRRKIKAFLLDWQWWLLVKVFGQGFCNKKY